MRRLIIIINLSLIVAFMMMFADCSDSSNGRKQVSIGYVNWSEGIAMSYLAKVMLESKGYDVMLRNADIAPVFVSMAAGKVDVFMDAWLPATHADYIRKYGDNLEALGVAYKNARMGLVVPSYVTIRSIEELNEHKEKFRNEIIGIDVGACHPGISGRADVKTFERCDNGRISPEIDREQRVDRGNRLDSPLDVLPLRP